MLLCQRLLRYDLSAHSHLAILRMEAIDGTELNMTRLRVAGAQIPVTDDIMDNVAAICRAIDFAKREDAHILLTPEGSLSGYTHEFDPASVVRALHRVTDLAREAGVGLALGTCFLEPNDNRCYNQIRFYERDGRYLGFHSKTLTCGTLDDPPEGEINHYAVKPIQTFRFASHPDRRSHLQRPVGQPWMYAGSGSSPQPAAVARMGARIIFHAVNGGRNGGAWSDLAWSYRRIESENEGIGRASLDRYRRQLPPERVALLGTIWHYRSRRKLGLSHRSSGRAAIRLHDPDPVASNRFVKSGDVGRV